ncbi:MAG TPA: hemolysin family protein [Planctomycetota bacterium]|nr:hemolysin family protein [Planctomycetota bacterium]
MSSETVINLLVIAFLVLANAFFVAAEFALVRVRRTRIQELVAAGNTTALVVKEAIDQLDDYISATQVGITLASLALGWVGESFLAHSIIEPLLVMAFSGSVEGGTVSATAHGISIGIAFFMITYLHVVIGELLPKSLALQFPEKMSLYVARPMRFCKIVFAPLIWLLNGSSNRIMKMLGVTPAHAHSLALSEEELLMLLSESKKAGVVSEDEQKMLQRVFKFHDKTVREIMIPRPDVIALDLRADENQISEAFRQGYSRMPVYDGTLNNVKGIVYVKDLIYTLQDPKLIKLIDLLRECIFVPESKEVASLLREFQKARVHMAIVVDEFGDTAGLVTLEDVIEEIVGEIQDEYDYEPAQIERGKDGVVIFDGKTDLDRFKELFPGFEMPEGSYETIAGLVFQLAGRVPRESDVLKHGGLSFKIVKRDGRRLRKIAIKHEMSIEQAAAGKPLSVDLAQSSAEALAAVPVQETQPESSISARHESAPETAPATEHTEPPPEAPFPPTRTPSSRPSASAPR